MSFIANHFLSLTVDPVGSTLVALQAEAKTNRVRLPTNLDQFVHYSTVQRGAVTEHVMTTPEAIEAIKNGESIPDRTQVVLADHRDGKVYRYFVMQKGDGWDNDDEATSPIDEWQFQWFWPNGASIASENSYQSPHRNQEGSHFHFTGRLLPHCTN